MKFPLLVAGLAVCVGMAAMGQTVQQSKKTAVHEETGMKSLTGKTIRWKLVDGPMPNTTFEHSFNQDGSVTWRIVDGQHQGATATEKSYAAVKVSDTIWVISYLSASGHTLTVVLNFDDHRAIGFGSNEKSWEPANGTFELLN